MLAFEKPWAGGVEGKPIVKAENLQLEMLNNIFIFSFLNDSQMSST